MTTKNVKQKTTRRSISMLVSILAFVFLTMACDDDEGEKINCEQLGDEIIELRQKFAPVVTGGSCAEIDTYFTKFISKLRAAEGCKNVEDDLQNMGFDGIPDYIEHLETEQAKYKDFKNCD